LRCQPFEQRFKDRLAVRIIQPLAAQLDESGSTREI
jgi:hypothetical protein